MFVVLWACYVSEDSFFYLPFSCGSVRWIVFSKCLLPIFEDVFSFLGCKMFGKNCFFPDIMIWVKRTFHLILFFFLLCANYRKKSLDHRMSYCSKKMTVLALLNICGARFAAYQHVICMWLLHSVHCRVCLHQNSLRANSAIFLSIIMSCGSDRCNIKFFRLYYSLNLPIVHLCELNPHVSQ